MAVLARTQFGEADVVLISHDPTSVSTDAPKDSILVNTDWFRKLDDGDTTNVVKMSFMDTVGAYTKQQNIAQATLSDGENISWDLDTQQSAKVILAGNRTLDNPTNQSAGATYAIIVTQDATGSRTLAFGSAYDFPGGTAPVLTTEANAVDILTFISDGTNMHGVASLDSK